MISLLRFLTSGESHGKCLSVILEGMPAGLGLSKNYIDSQLQRRQVGYGRGKRMEIEKDEVEILSGLRFGKTLGSPIALLIKNRDWENWQDVMRVEECEIVPLKITKPRPGHADLPGLLKYHQEDIRNVLERSSARETAARVAAGAVARKLLAEFGINIISHTIQIGKIKAKIKERNLSEIAQLAEASSLRCADKAAESKMIEEIDKAQETGDSLGGIFEVLASGVPVGLGS
ncbi:MAG: chorismate synthase, partial [candidate division WOR-3 bacterium]